MAGALCRLFGWVCGKRLEVLARFLCVVLDSSVNRVFRKHRAVELDWRERQLLCNVSVLHLICLVQTLPLDLLGGQRARCNCATTPKRLELCISDVSVVVHVNLGIFYPKKKRDQEVSMQESSVSIYNWQRTTPGEQSLQWNKFLGTGGCSLGGRGMMENILFKKKRKPT